MKYYTGKRTHLHGAPVLLSRTGYTGEDGCEIIASADDIRMIWSELYDAGQAAELRPAGLGCRDTLRLEAAMPLYGHELSEEINAAQTGLPFAIQTKNREFIGRTAILAAQQNAALPQRVGLEIQSKRAAREHCPIFHGEQEVGTVTSGTFAPTLNKTIAMGYVAREYLTPGTELTVDIRGHREAARVVAMPFYTRTT